MISLSIVFDNYAYKEGFPTLWGFSCFVQTPEVSFLFDTGSNGRVLLRNMQRMGIDLTQADSVILSHPHWDHIGGIDSVLEAHPDVTLFVPSSLSKFMIRDLETQSLGVTVIDEHAQEILPNVYTTGIMGEIGEQAIIVDTPQGLIVLTGCAHPGIVQIAQRAINLLHKPIHLLMGGFHLMHEPAEHIAAVIDTLDALGVQQVCPTHCSGDLAIAMFKTHFGERCFKGGTGQQIVFT